MVLDHDAAPRDALGFAQEPLAVRDVMQHVAQQRDIDRSIRERDRAAVEGEHLDRSARPYLDVETPDREVGPDAAQLQREPAVTASHIEHMCAFRDRRGDRARERDVAPRDHERLVQRGPEPP